MTTNLWDDTNLGEFIAANRTFLARMLSGSAQPRRDQITHAINFVREKAAGERAI